MTEQSIDYEGLRKLAEAAAAGPWEAECDEDEGEITVNAGTALTEWTEYDDDTKVGTPSACYLAADRIIKRYDMWDDDFRRAAADAEFIAATHPGVVLALLDRITELEAAMLSAQPGSDSTTAPGSHDAEAKIFGARAYIAKTIDNIEELPDDAPSWHHAEVIEMLGDVASELEGAVPDDLAERANAAAADWRRERES